MSNMNRRKYLEKVAKTPQLLTHTIDPDVARQLPIIFGFKNLNLDKKPFNCSPKHGDSLLYILNTLKLFSQVIRMHLEMNYPHCHLVPDDQVKTHNLFLFLSLAPNKKLHQLGRKGTPQRIVGYFDSPTLNLFQVCLLDLNHKLSGD